MAAFAEVLDGKLGAGRAERPRVAPPWTCSRIPPHPFLGAEPQRRFGARLDAWAGSPRSAPARPRPHALTPDQQHAFDSLLKLGADLRADFTARELRSAFRAMARRLHPDRHPFRTDAERAELAFLFAQVCEHYRMLLVIGERGV